MDFQTDPTVAGFQAQHYSHTDRWELRRAEGTLLRLHRRPRRALFKPDGAKDCPVDMSELAPLRESHIDYGDGNTETLVDDWTKVEQHWQEKVRVVHEKEDP